MRDRKKHSRAEAKVLELLRKAGVDEEIITKAKDSIPEPKDAVTLQGEAVLIYLEKPARFTLKRCKWCDETFGTNYRNVSYCSDDHRAKAILSKTGLVWNHQTATENRLRYDPSLTIPPAHVEQLSKFCREFLRQYENQDCQSKIVAGKVVQILQAEESRPTPEVDYIYPTPEPVPAGPLDFDIESLPSFY